MFQLKLVRTNPPSAEYLATAAETHKVYVKYQMTIHNDKPEKCSEPKFEDFLVASPLLVSSLCGIYEYKSMHTNIYL